MDPRLLVTLTCHMDEVEPFRQLFLRAIVHDMRRNARAVQRLRFRIDMVETPRIHHAYDDRDLRS